MPIRYLCVMQSCHELRRFWKFRSAVAVGPLFRLEMLDVDLGLENPRFFFKKVLGF